VQVRAHRAWFGFDRHGRFVPLGLRRVARHAGSRWAQHMRIGVWSAAGRWTVCRHGEGGCVARPRATQSGGGAPATVAGAIAMERRRWW
jgi:hypothetical protein